MLSNEVKENMIVGIIMESHVSPSTKTELIDYVRSHNGGAVQAAFRLGQMDMQMSTADVFRNCAAAMEGRCGTCNLAAAAWVESLGVI